MPVRREPVKRKTKRKPYTLPSGPRGDVGTGGGYTLPRTPTRRPKPTGVFRGPVKPATEPITRAQRQATRRADRARRRLPPRPLPHVPVVRNPTPAQTEAARRIITRAITRAVGPQGTGAQRLARRREVERDFLDDRRMAQAISHYGRAAERHAALGIARAHGVGGSKQQRIATGRRLLAQRQVPFRPKPAPRRLGIGPASINLTAVGDVGQDLGQRLASGHGSGISRFLPRAASAIGGDIKTIATAPFIAAYETGAAGYEAARGDTGRAERLASGAWEGIKESAPGQLLQGDLEGAAAAFGRDPLISVLDFAGLGAVAGRGTGAIARGVGSRPDRPGVRGALARGGSTVRPPLAMVDDAGTVSLVERRYSKDATRKAAQVRSDRRRKPLKRKDGSVVTVDQGGRKVPVLLARDRPTAQYPRGERGSLLRGEADFAASRANMLERLVRDRASREMRVRGIKGRNARDLVAMVVEGTVTSARHFEADLKAHATRLRGEIARHEGGDPVFRHRGELQAAQARLKLVEKALTSPSVKRQQAKIVAAGEAIGRKLNEQEREAIRLGLLTPSRAERSRRVPVAVEHLEGRHFTADELKEAGESVRYGELRRSDGRRLTNEEVDEFLRERGRDPESVAYLPHRMDTRGGRAFHAQFRPGARGSMERPQTRTGEAYRKGATESSAALIREHGVRQRTQIAKAQQLDRMVADHGMRRPDGKLWTAREALEAADRIEADTGTRLVPVRAFAAKLDRETQRIIRDDLQGPGAMESLGLRLLNDRIVHAGDTPGSPRARNVVLMPDEYVKRLQQHLQPAGEILKFLQFLNRPFRFAVLAQPRWLVGNFVEPFVVRLTTTGSGLNVFGLGVDIAAATRTLRAMERSADPKVRAAAAELRAQQLGGLFIGGRGASVRRSADEFEVYGEVVARLPVVRQGAELLGLVGRALMAPAGAYFRLNRAIENVAQRAALGRDIRRDLHAFRGSWLATLRLQRTALEEAGRGLVGTAAQRRLIRSQHELLGKYEGYPPWMRRAIQGAFPFIPWALNAARFTMWTMPAHRTVQTALAVKVNDVVARDWEEIHRNTPPGGLRLAIPTKRGGWVDLARYTPWGLSGPIAEGDAQAITDQAFPVFSGAVEAVQGRDPFGRPLRLDPSENAGETEPNLGQRAGIAGNALLEALVPYLGQGRRVREGGGTGYSGSTILDPDVKPGSTHMSGLRRTFDPFRPTYLNAPNRRSKIDPGERDKLLRGLGGGSAAVAEDERARLLRGLNYDAEIDAALDATEDFAGLDPDEEEKLNRILDAMAP